MDSSNPLTPQNPLTSAGPSAPLDDTAATYPRSLEALRIDVARIIGENPQAIAPDDDLMDWGLDSLRLLDLVTGWNEAGLVLDLSELAGQLTLDRMWQVISARQPQS